MGLRGQESSRELRLLGKRGKRAARGCRRGADGVRGRLLDEGAGDEALSSMKRALRRIFGREMELIVSLLAWKGFRGRTLLPRPRPLPALVPPALPRRPGTFRKEAALARSGREEAALEGRSRATPAARKPSAARDTAPASAAPGAPAARPRAAARSAALAGGAGLFRTIWRKRASVLSTVVSLLGHGALLAFLIRLPIRMPEPEEELGTIEL